jgi:hypothetical protein
MPVRQRHLALFALLASASGGALASASGCAKGSASPVGGGGSGGGSATASQATSSSSSTSGIVLNGPDAGDAGDAGDDGPDGFSCNSKCGPTELCDPPHIGLDDNCNGLVDETCPCSPGDVHWCFKGDPEYRNTPGCFDGSEQCTELGMWGPCTGGFHAAPPDLCYQNNTSLCHAITAPPFATIDLKTGTGSFSANAVAGSESYAVTCPAGVSQCPSVQPPESYTPLQSGEYEVLYTKSVSGSPNPLTCTFPLIVAAPGLRVELTWEHHLTDMGVDLDLHMHQPVTTAGWNVSSIAAPQDCGFSSCRVYGVLDAGAPDWFPSGNVAPQPCNWDLSTTANGNTCYNDPKGAGPVWAALGKGCHNPRLDVDEIQCDDSVTNPASLSFCAPENINIDYPPNAQWARLAVHYYSNHGLTYDVHPEVKVFCNGALSADLGPNQFYSPQSPVTFEAADGAGNGTGNRFWIVADVAFTTDACGNQSCTVLPIYSDAANKTPFFTLDTAAEATFAPPWPAPP